MLVTKQRFHLDTLTLEHGGVLHDVNVGYEIYGTLNVAKDNAIIVAHYFSGSSHAAGYYRETDQEPGYWDPVIGAGKPIDTNKYFVIGVDSLCNLNPGNPDVITTGPQSINPQTGKVYGADFPIVSIGDFVEIQKRLCDKLGITRLHAVVGPSMGSMQAMEWTARFPKMAPRAICVVPCGLAANPYLVGLLNCWGAPVRLDPNFRDGRYEAAAPPREGVIEALKLITLTALNYDGVQETYGRAVADTTNLPSASWKNQYAVEAELSKIARERSKFSDGNSLLRLTRAVQLFNIRDRLDRIEAKFLFIPAASDLMMPVKYAQDAVSELRVLGLTAEYCEIPGNGGHLDGVYRVDRVGKQMAAFLDS